MKEKKALKFEKKNILIILAVLLVVIIAIVAIVLLTKKTGNTLKPVSSKPINMQVQLNTVFAELSTFDEFNTNISNPTVDGEGENSGENDDGIPPEELPENQVPEPLNESEIDFGIYAPLDKKAIINTNDSTVSEVWMIKLSNMNQQEAICRILGTRLQKLRNSFKDDARNTAILNSAVIKQEDAIVIMIISENVREIEETISNAMMK